MNVAVVVDGVVVNVVVADDLEAASSVVTVGDLVAVDDATGSAYIGGDLAGGRFRPPRPFASWAWDPDAWEWVAPVPYPSDGADYIWDEEQGAWIEYVAPEPEPAVKE